MISLKGERKTVEIEYVDINHLYKTVVFSNYFIPLNKLNPMRKRVGHTSVTFVYSEYPKESHSGCSGNKYKIFEAR